MTRHGQRCECQVIYNRWSNILGGGYEIAMASCYSDERTRDMHIVRNYQNGHFIFSLPDHGFAMEMYKIRVY